HLQAEQGVHVEDVSRLPARGGEAYGFTFSVSDEARGRVAVVKSGEHVALVIASWPMGAPPAVAEDVEAMIGSLGPPPDALPPGGGGGGPVACWKAWTARAKSATSPPAASTAAAW